jgi:hypothetical protein
MLLSREFLNGFYVDKHVLPRTWSCKRICILPTHCLYMFHIFLTIDSDFLHKPNTLTI